MQRYKDSIMSFRKDNALYNRFTTNIEYVYNKIIISFISEVFFKARVE